jgi:hypothetical protein
LNIIENTFDGFKNESIPIVLRELPQLNEASGGGANKRDMADKTASMQPSTLFHEAASPVTHPLTDPFTSASSYTSSTLKSIVCGVNQPDNMERKNQFDIKSLMSPPEPTPHESFARASPTKPMDSQMKTLFPMPGGRFPMSPPVSPATKNITTDESPAFAVRDPVLYPNAELQSSPSSQTPLFNEDEASAQRVVDEHVAARKLDNLFRDREASPPRQSDYELALEFKAQVAKQFDANRKKWLNRERLFLLEDRALQNGTRRYTNIAPASGGKPRNQPPKQNGSKNGVIKVRSPPHPKTNHIRNTPDRSMGPKVAREDKDFDLLPDFCPPLSSLPTKPNSLKVDWRGAPIDLRNDPNAHLLHADEILLAANLRLDCATYLTSKRRIFIKRIDALRIGKEFRKTDAQQACKIDVNKASKLWSAFDKVGWLDPKWVKKYM